MTSTRASTLEAQRRALKRRRGSVDESSLRIVGQDDRSYLLTDGHGRLGFVVDSDRRIRHAPRPLESLYKATRWDPYTGSQDFVVALLGRVVEVRS